MIFESAVIGSPKRIRRRTTGWNAFFPYYAGYPASFASELIGSVGLARDGRIFDPWNGSGTTTFTASEQTFDAVGVDLNPAMVIVARARSIQPSEADSLVPLANEILQQATGKSVAYPDEPLNQWFDERTACEIRAIEGSIRHLLVGSFVTNRSLGRLDRISPIAATFYVALFAACRSAAAGFRSTNPTWFKCARKPEDRLAISQTLFLSTFNRLVAEMAASLSELSPEQDRGAVQLCWGDSVDSHVSDGSIDLVLTSPPYCTRIDYTSATRIELAVASPLYDLSYVDLGRKMVGSTRVPQTEGYVRDSWGPTCISLISAISNHPSRASAGYYRKTHIDYFGKIDLSLSRISAALKSGGGAVIIVQDSYYKEIHNDLPRIFCEMASGHQLELARRDDFELSSTIAARHPHTAKYGKPKGATESVLCFIKS